MSKELSDILGRLNGDMMALMGVETRFAPPLPVGPPTVEQAAAAAPPPPVSPAQAEDYLFAKKLLTDIEGLAKSAVDEINKTLKIPQPSDMVGTTQSPPPGGAPPEAAHKEASGSKK